MKDLKDTYNDIMHVPADNTMEEKYSNMKKELIKIIQNTDHEQLICILYALVKSYIQNSK